MFTCLTVGADYALGQAREQQKTRKKLTKEQIEHRKEHRRAKREYFRKLLQEKSRLSDKIISEVVEEAEEKDTKLSDQYGKLEKKLERVPPVIHGVDYSKKRKGLEYLTFEEDIGNGREIYIQSRPRRRGKTRNGTIMIYNKDKETYEYILEFCVKNNYFEIYNSVIDTTGQEPIAQIKMMRDDLKDLETAAELLETWATKGSKGTSKMIYALFEALRGWDKLQEQHKRGLPHIYQRKK